ncbi:hypothetical protein BG004_006662, partial [Podila humilis]
MTSLSAIHAIHLQVLAPVYTNTSSNSGSTSSTQNLSDDGHHNVHFSDVDMKEDSSSGSEDDNNDDRYGDEENQVHRRSTRGDGGGERLQYLENHGRYLDVPLPRRAPNVSHTTLVADTSQSTITLQGPWGKEEDDEEDEDEDGTVTEPSQDAKTKKRKKKKKKNGLRGIRRMKSIQIPFTRTASSTLSSSSANAPAVVGIDHALRLNFLSTLGPGIPMSPTVSVFGDGLNGFINRNPLYPGGIFGYSPEEEKRLVRKIDWRIIPILGLFYGVSTLS